MDIEFNRPLLDELTLTSYGEWLGIASTDIIWRYGRPEEKKIHRYEGVMAWGEEGSVFCGHGHQQGRKHTMTRLSSYMAHKHGVKMLGGVDWGGSNCSRVDVQITVHDWLDLDAMGTDWVGQARGEIMVYSTRQGKKTGDTLYVGSPRSDRRVRIYHKAGGTRFEIQYRRDYALSMAKMIATSPDVGRLLGGVLAAEVERLPGGLGAFSLILGKPGQIPPSIRRVAGDTERWIREQVAPAMMRECARNEDLRRWLLSELNKI